MVAPLLEAPSSTAETGGTYHAVSAVNLRVGTRLRIPILDGRNVLLLARGAVVTSNFLQKLKLRGITEVRVHESELARVYACTPQGTAQAVPPDRDGHFVEESNAGTNSLDGLIAQGGHLGLPPQGEAFANDLVSHGLKGYNHERLEDFVSNHEVAMSQVEDVYNSLASGRGLDTEALGTIADEALNDLSSDADLFSCLGINPHSDRYPVRHSIHVGMLAVAIGTRLKLDRQTLKELSMGCLVHDAGMLKIDGGVWSGQKVIDRISFLEITKHPVKVFDMLKSLENIPSRAAFVAYQIHERCNGSGYPRRRDGNQIHFLSKVAAVADAYIALVSPRPHRNGMLPYKAIGKILDGVKDGLFDPSAVRALLNTVSLFPIGSFVELSDGRVGKVIRSNGDLYHQPIIEVWKRGETHLLPDVVDLKGQEDLKVVRPLVSLPASEALTEIADNWE